MTKSDLFIAGLLSAVAAITAVEISNLAKQGDVTSELSPVEQVDPAKAIDAHPLSMASGYDTDKAAVGYWKAACDIKHGHIHRSEGAGKVVAYWQELGIDPAQAYGDANATTRAEMFDKKAGTNCFA